MSGSPDARVRPGMHEAVWNDDINMAVTSHWLSHYRISCMKEMFGRLSDRQPSFKLSDRSRPQSAGASGRHRRYSGIISIISQIRSERSA